MRPGHRPRRLVLALATLVGVGTGVLARDAHADPAGEDLFAAVVTFGPGDHPFFKFGHNAIWIRPRTGTDLEGMSGQGLVFNFGTFAFDSPGLIAKFLRGRLVYWLSVSPADSAFRSYTRANRTIEVHELDLTPDERAALLARLRHNARPENREYLYDYFLDNCSTRVRDAVDAITNGRVGRAGARPGDQTLRDHALRMTADLPWEYLSLHFLLGPSTDRPIDRWAESFLPDEFRDLLRDIPIEGAAARPLVKSEATLFQARRPAKPARAPSWTGWLALVGLGLGGVLATLGWVAGGSGAGAGSGRGGAVAARVALGALAALVGLVVGLLGWALVLLWAFTNHKVAHGNANILQFAPFALVLAVLGVAVAMGQAASREARGAACSGPKNQRPSARAATVVAAAAAALSLLGLAAKLLPGIDQDNLAFIALLLPVWLGMTFGLDRVRRAA
jgi:hypothetical protein